MPSMTTMAMAIIMAAASDDTNIHTAPRGLKNAQ
jgi:hypothetical protein